MKTLFRLFLDALYPPGAVCISCGAFHTSSKEALCEECIRKLYPLKGPFCPHCGRPGWAMLCPECCNTLLDSFFWVRGGHYYEGTAGALVRELKYSGVRASLPLLTSGMLQNLPEGRYDGFVPVPLHPKRLRERGFNQSELLCRAMSEKSGIPVLNALARTRQTSSQAKLSGKERHTNILDAFSCVMDVSGQTLILVDDVVTTGSTASACAKALLSAGAKQVCLLCAARADLKRPQDS